MTNNMSVEEAAAIMGVSKEFLRLGLQQRRFPFGEAVKMGCWRYYLNRRRFELYMEGRLISCQDATADAGNRQGQ